MKRLLLGALTLSLVVAAVAFSGNLKASNGFLVIQGESRNPWTHLRLNDEPDTFHFAVVSDRTGGHRARIFSEAVSSINLLQPAFVLSVGDLIEGYTQDGTRLASEWKEFQTYTSKLQMPFFYVPGNHDVSNSFQEKAWQERFGRRYYHFLYRNTLFLMLCTDDPAEKSQGQVSKEQADYVQRVVKANPSVRWTFVAVHKPLWDQANLDKNGWLEVEKALEGRPYTVFAGHIHRYQKFIRQGQNYYQLATTGGSSKMRGLRYGEFDHVAWVTMKKDGPTVANIMLDGILPEDLKRTFTDEEGSERYNRKPTQPVAGKVFLDGTPVANARVDFHLIEGDKRTRIADGLTEADGSFNVSTYKAGDGVPTGDYAVTVVLRRLSPDGTLTPNSLPTQFSAAATTPLRAKVKTGANDFTFNLTK